MREISKDFAIQRIFPANHEGSIAIKIGLQRPFNDREYCFPRSITDLVERPLSVYARVAGTLKRPYTAGRFEIRVAEHQSHARRRFPHAA